MSALGFDNGRVGRLIDLLAKKPVLSVEDNRNIQLDVMDNEWANMKSVLTLSGLSGETKLAYDYLKDWDGMANQDAIGVTIFSMWLVELSRAIYNVENQDMPLWAKIDFDKQFVIQILKKNQVKAYGFKSSEEMKLKTFEKALGRLKEKLGDDVSTWQWNRLHQALFVNNIANKIPGVKSIYNRTIPMPGSRETINCMRWNVLFAPFQFKQGPSLRMLVDMSKGDSLVSIPMGASENPFTDRYDNLLQQWVDGDYQEILQSPKSFVDDQVLNIVSEKRS
jgi:penicillin amidase